MTCITLFLYEQHRSYMTCFNSELYDHAPTLFCYDMLQLCFYDMLMFNKSTLIWHCTNLCSIHDMLQLCSDITCFNLIWHASTLFLYAILQLCSYMTCFNSVLIWHASTLFLYDMLQLCSDMTCFNSVLIWHASTLFLYDMLQLCSYMTCFNSVLIWHASTLFASTLFLVLYNRCSGSKHLSTPTYCFNVILLSLREIWIHRTCH